MKRAPQGYRIKTRELLVDPRAYVSSQIVEDDLTKSTRTELLKHGEMVGYVDTVLTRDHRWETHSYLDQEERGKGFGSLLYTKAINFNMKRHRKVCSSKAPSIQAKRVWTSRVLSELFLINYDGIGYNVIKRLD